MYKISTIFVWSGKSTNPLRTREGGPNMRVGDWGGQGVIVTRPCILDHVRKDQVKNRCKSECWWCWQRWCRCFFKRITFEERLYYYYDQKGGRDLRIVVASAETLFAPLNCLPLLKFCFSSFSLSTLLFPLFYRFFFFVFFHLISFPSFFRCDIVRATELPSSS